MSGFQLVLPDDAALDRDAAKVIGEFHDYAEVHTYGFLLAELRKVPSAQKRASSSRHHYNHDMIAIGDLVVIFRIDPAGWPSIEGHAVVRGLSPTRLFPVQFEGERQIKERVVVAEFQENPEGILAALRELATFSSEDRPLSDEFYPEPPSAEGASHD